MTSSSRKVIIFGDSHVGPIFHVKSFKPELFNQYLDEHTKVCWIDNGMISYSFVLRVGTPPSDEINPIVLMNFESHGIYSRYTKQWSNEANLVFLTGFAESHILGFRWEWQGYKFSEDPSASDAFRWIPNAMIRETIEARLKPYFTGLTMIREAGFPVLQVAGPPPHRDVAKAVGALPFTLAPLARRALYRMIVDVFEEKARQIGFDFMRADFLADEEGFLSSDFEGDGVHTNEEGGKAILSQLRCWFTEIGRDGTSVG